MFEAVKSTLADKDLEHAEVGLDIIGNTVKVCRRCLCHLSKLILIDNNLQ